MKKSWLWLCLLLLAVLPVQALAAEGDAVIARNDNLYVDNCFVMDDALVLYGNEFYVYHLGDEDVTHYPFVYDEAELAGSENCYFSIANTFSDGEKIHAIAHVFDYSDDESELVKTMLCEIELTDAGEAVIAATTEFEWPDELMEDYGNGQPYPMYLENCTAAAGVIYFSTWGNMGQEFYAMSIEEMEPRRIELDFENADILLPYTDGRVLIVVNDYNTQQIVYQAYSYEDDRCETICEIPMEDYNYYSGYAADPETGRLYCISGGEICEINLETGELGEGLSDMPLSVYSNRAGQILNGQYYVYVTYEGTVVRNLAPEQKPEKKLKVLDGAYLDSVTDAYFDFTNANGNVAVSIDRDSGTGDLVENMMNRSDEVDVYIVDLSYSSYSSLLERGFLAELDGSEQLAASVEGMYPAWQEVCMRNGKVVAIPVRAYCWPFGVNERALERIGLTIDDVPTNWSDFLDFLANDLPAAMETDPDVSLFYADYTQSSVRQVLFGQIFQDYQNYANAQMDIPSYDTPLLNELLTKVESLDLDALNVKPDEERETEDGSYIVAYSGEDSSVLFETSVGASFGNFYYSEYTPVVMAMDAETLAILAMDGYVAFVNPFSKNIDLAIAFVETLQRNLETEITYNFYPDLTEPIRRENYEEQMQYAQEYYDQTKKQYDEAEEADKQAMEEILKDAERWLEQEEQYSWQISADQIEWFRSNDDNLAIAQGNWLYQDSSGEAQELMMQYYQGQIGVKQFLSGIEKKVRMMMMEGM